MEDELMAILSNTSPDRLANLESRAKNVYQQLQNVGASGGSDYSQNPTEMKAKGYHWNGFGWVK